MPWPIMRKNGHIYEDYYREEVFFRGDLLGRGNLKTAFIVYRHLVKNSDSLGEIFTDAFEIQKSTRLSIISVRAHIKKLIAMELMSQIPEGFKMTEEYYINKNPIKPLKLTETEREPIKKRNKYSDMKRVRKLVKTQKNENWKSYA